MPRSLLSMTLLALLILAATYGSANAQTAANGEYDSDGDGLIEVEFLEQLDAIRYDVNGDGKSDDVSDIDAYAAAFPTGATEAVCDDCHGYELARPLDFAAAASYASGAVNTSWRVGEGWLPIQSGELSFVGGENPFAATFDGNGHTISNLYINRSDRNEGSGPVGLFGSAVDAVIRNVGLVDVDVAGFAVVGGLVGIIPYGHIKDSYVTGSVAGSTVVGGLAGWNHGAISGSHFSGSVSALETDWKGGGRVIGGLVGLQDYGVITASYASGSVAGVSRVGGLVGEIKGGGYVVASHSSADVAGRDGAGGLAGVNRFLISGSYATGSVTGERAVGGLAGYHGAVGMIVASYATGEVTGNNGVGGLVGSNGFLVTASYATGPVSGKENVGGLVGWNTDRAGVTASYATGRVSGGDNVGGLIGFNLANVLGGVWDVETSGVVNGVGRGNAAGVTGQTTAQMLADSVLGDGYRDWDIHFAYDDGRYYRYLERAPGPYDLWDFGTSDQYPALKAYLDFDGVADWWESGRQPRAARPPALEPTRAVAPGLVARYDGDGDGLIEVSNLEQLYAIRYDLDGDGIPEDPSEDEHAAAYSISDGEAVCGNDCRGYELARPLDFADAESYASGAVNGEWTTGGGWRPIGAEEGYDGRFNAIFEGNGHPIANLYIDRSDSSEDPPAIGLFGFAGYSAVIRNAVLVNASVAGLGYVGGMIGHNRGEIRDSHANGSVSGHHRIGRHQDAAGGLVGRNEWTVVGSHAAVRMSCGDNGDKIGGLVGANGDWGTVDGSYATGRVSCAKGDSLGGLIGANWGTIRGSYATGDVVGDTAVGGLVGSRGNDGVIIASHATGDVTGDYGVGGLAGGGAGVIAGSYATGKVTGGRRAGGLSGSNGGTILASYATGAVSGKNSVGGLVGTNDYGRVIAAYATGAVSGESGVGGLAGSGGGGEIIASYATGNVSGENGVGGLTGAFIEIIEESVSFWNKETTGQETSVGGTGKTTAELQEPAGYTGIYAGWNADLDDADEDKDPSTGVDDFWDFGTSAQYPALKADFNGDGDTTWQEFGNQRGGATDPQTTAMPLSTPEAAPGPPPATCVEIMTTATISGTWAGDCPSSSHPGSYARFYTFTLAEQSDVTIDLESGEPSAYLYLLRAPGAAGAALISRGSGARNTRINSMAAGTYIIEATVNACAEAGSFTLTVSGLDETESAPVPEADEAPVPSATPALENTPAPVPTETPAAFP